MRPGAGGGSLGSVSPSQSCSGFQNFKQNPNYLIFLLLLSLLWLLFLFVYVCAHARLVQVRKSHLEVHSSSPT